MLAVPLRRKLFSPKLVVPVICGLLVVGVVASSSHYVRTVTGRAPRCRTARRRCTTRSSRSSRPCSTQHPLLGLGLNTFSVYYQFQTGRTDWGPHSFYVALIAETGLIGTAAFGLFLIWLLVRLAVLRRAARLLARSGDPDEARAGPLADGLLAALLGTMAANVFYLTMQFYYFYALVLVIVTAAELYAPAPEPKPVPVKLTPGIAPA